MLCSHYVQREAGRSEGFVFLLFMNFLLWDFTREDALGAVCSLLCPGSDSGFDRDEENVNLTSEAHDGLKMLFKAVDMTVLRVNVSRTSVIS